MMFDDYGNRGLYVLIDISLTQSITGGIFFFLLLLFLILLFGENFCASKGVWQPLRTPPTSSAIPQIIKVSGLHGKQRGGIFGRGGCPGNKLS